MFFFFFKKSKYFFFFFFFFFFYKLFFSLVLFNSTDASSVAGKKDKFLVEWITMLDTDTQSDAKSLWSAVAADRPIQQHKIIAYVGRRPDDDPNAPQHASAIRNNKRRVPSKLASSLTVPDAAEFNDTHLNDSSTTASAAAAAATTTTAAAAAAPVVVTSNVSPTSIVVTPSSTTSSSAASEQTPVTQFTTPKASNSADDADIKQLQLQLSQVMQERDKLAAQLAAAQRALTAASSAAANAASAGSKSSSSSSALANPVPAPDQGIAKHLYLIALLMVVFAFLFGRFSVATNAWFAAGNNNSTA
jgi:hypothetical protein